MSVHWVYMVDPDQDFVHMARFALTGRGEDAAALVRRSLPDLSRRRPELAKQAKDLLALADGTRGRGVLRGGIPDSLPVDHDTHLELLRREDHVDVRPEPVWAPDVERELNAVVEERRRAAELESVGLAPSRSILFVGQPGVGKTLAARWLAGQLERPLMTLDLAAVMSSFLGRTGNNIRVVLDYARKAPCVLLLDEFDAIAKRRDDTSEVGELKRLVTVLLQAIDDWPVDGLLVAATNHPELLDPAVWRRFDRVVEFPKPDAAAISQLLTRLLGDGDEYRDPMRTLAAVFAGQSQSEIERNIIAAKRSAFLRSAALPVALLEVAASFSRNSDKAGRLTIANALASNGVSQRRISELTGLSRDTIRRHRVASA
jgi:SpoVK/Ycf46/Vps4 family AAA+-type ATPase